MLFAVPSLSVVLFSLHSHFVDFFGMFVSLSSSFYPHLCSFGASLAPVISLWLYYFTPLLLAFLHLFVVLLLLFYVSSAVIVHILSGANFPTGDVNRGCGPGASNPWALQEGQPDFMGACAAPLDPLLVRKQEYWEAFDFAHAHIWRIHMRPCDKISCKHRPIFLQIGA